jgi:hypothetical protein
LAVAKRLFKVWVTREDLALHKTFCATDARPIPACDVCVNVLGEAARAFGPKTGIVFPLVEEAIFLWAAGAGLEFRGADELILWGAEGTVGD